MEGSLVTNDKEEKISSFTEVFEEQCPYFMAIGMTYQEYWYEDCWLSEYYLKAYKIKQEQKNQELWLQGVYIYEALIDVSPILHPFSKKGTKPLEYPKKPYSLFEDKKEKEEEIEIERKRALDFFKNWGKSVANKIENKK